jgi:hypothetical protein
MRAFRYLAAIGFVILAGTARPDDKKVLVPGDPPLTQDMVDDYGKLAEWRFGPVLAKVGGVDRLRQMVINDWKNGDAKRQKTVLADLKWWREDYPKLRPAERDVLSGKAPPPSQPSNNFDAIHLLKLQQWNDARQAEIRAMSNAQARHHETMMLIIHNLRPTWRLEYNPATGKYDRYGQ